MAAAAVDEGERWRDLDKLLTRPGNITGPGFEPSPELRELLREHVRVLCVGAGGLGCELLKDLALTGFGNIDVIDMDTIDVSNLNRQFLFRMADVGKPKAEVAAARVMERVQGVTVTPHFCRIEEKPLDWYEQFQLIVLGLDSLEARRYMNQVACSFLDFDEDGEPDQASCKPMVDGGTEGFKGHVRVILPGFTPCFECTLWMFPPQTKFPLCTLAETPRSAPHCIEYVHLIRWGQERPGEDFDVDVEEHMQWVFAKAQARAEQFGIPGVTPQLTAGVVKNIIPAIASTNAIVAAACTLEALKMVTLCSTGIDNYMICAGCWAAPGCCSAGRGAGIRVRLPGTGRLPLPCCSPSLAAPGSRPARTWRPAARSAQLGLAGRPLRRRCRRRVPPGSVAARAPPGEEQPGEAARALARRYTGTEGVYAPVHRNARSDECPMCSPGVPLEVDPGSSLQEVLDAMVRAKVGGAELTAPSVSYGSANLYMRGPLEEATRPNLAKPISALVGGSGSVVSVNDRKLLAPLRVKLKFADSQMANGA